MYIYIYVKWLLYPHDRVYTRVIPAAVLRAGTIVTVRLIKKVTAAKVIEISAGNPKDPNVK